MATNHEFQVVEKEVVFTEEAPTSPLKLFTVAGDVLAFITPVIKSEFSHDNATLLFGEQGKIALGSIDSVGGNPLESSVCRVVSGDIYQTIRMDEGEVDLTSGTVVFYCVFAPLSADGLVQGIE